MADFYVKVGDSARFSKTVGEYDVYSFAGITGDFSPNHVNKSYMEKSSYGRLQAHGALMVGYMSTASTYVIAHTRERADETPVSLGYDRIRFLAPVFGLDDLPFGAVELEDGLPVLEIDAERTAEQRDEDGDDQH